MTHLRRIAACSLHFWKRQMRIPTPSLTRTTLVSTGDGTDGKAKLFEKLRFLTGDYLELISREQDKKGVSLTKADLADWAKRLSDDGNHERALEIYQWIETKKMTFSPSELANFVDLLCKTRGLPAARAYFRKLDPVFDYRDPDAKNWPAFRKLLDAKENGNAYVRKEGRSNEFNIWKNPLTLVYNVSDKTSKKRFTGSS